MGFKIGNKYGRESGKFFELFDRAEKQQDYKRMRAMCEAVWDLAEKGEKWAVEMVRDEYDGKPDTNINLGVIATPEGRVRTLAEFLSEVRDEESRGETSEGEGISSDGLMVSPAVSTQTH